MRYRPVKQGDEGLFLECLRALLATENYDLDATYEQYGFKCPPRPALALKQSTTAAAQTPLQFAVGRGWVKVMEYLLARDDVDVDANGYSRSSGKVQKPLHRAVEHKNRKAVELLLGAGARVDCGDTYGRTPLHYAAAYASQDIVKLLLSRGAALDARDDFGILAGAQVSNSKTGMARFLAEIRRAGGWNAFVRVPRNQLLALRRELPTLRRHSPCRVRVHARLFLDARVPDDVFMHVLAFWRSDRDA